MLGAPAGLAAGAGGARLPGRAVPLPRLVLGRGAAASCTSGWPARPAAPAERARAARAGRARRRRATGGSRRCRRECSSGSGSPRRWSASPRLLLLDEPTSALDPVGRRIVRGAARGAARPRRRRAAQLAPAERGRAGLRPGGDHRPRHAWSRPARPAELAGPRRRGGRDRRRACASSRAPAARTRRGSSPSWSPPASGSTGSRSATARSRTSTSRRSGADRMTPSPLRSAATVIGLLGPGGRPPAGLPRRARPAPLAFLALYALGAHFAFRDASDFAGGRSGDPRSEGVRRRDDLRPGDVRDPLPRRRAGRLPHPRRGPRRRRARAAAAAGRAPDRPHDDAAGRFAGAASSSARLRGRSSTSPPG